MLATAGGGGMVIAKKFSDISKKNSGYSTFLPKYDNIFPDIPKNFADI